MILFCINFGWKEHFFLWRLWNCQPSVILGRPEYCHPAPNWHDRLTALLREESGIDGHRWIQLDREPASNLPSCEIAPHIDNWPSHPHSMAHWRPPPIRKAVRVYHRVWYIQEKLQWIRSYVSSSSKSHPGWPTPPPKPQSLEFQRNQRWVYCAPGLTLTLKGLHALTLAFSVWTISIN